MSMNRRKELTTKDKEAHYLLRGRRCKRCGSRKGLEFDHVIPLKRGGNNDKKNFQILCRDCHIQKTREEIHGLPLEVTRHGALRMILKKKLDYVDKEIEKILGEIAENEPHVPGKKLYSGRGKVKFLTGK